MTVKEVFAEQLNMEVDEIDEKASIKYELGIDSLDLATMIAKMEELYEIHVELEEVKDIDTIEEIEKFVNRKISGD